ncbi:MAG: penicillin-binding protein 2, partial [Candidatus Portnoybacteria bacterium]|nr:penicillin-binding protein 2 [Candidatus Portnoybacteria bacterium]
EVPLTAKIFRVFFGIIAVVLLILLGWTFWLQVFQGQGFGVLAKRNYTRGVLLPAARGIIYDRDNRQLVLNVPSFNLLLTPQDLPKDAAAEEAIIERVAQILAEDKGKIYALLEQFDINKAQNILAASGLSHEQVLALEAEQDSLAGFRLEENAIRQYVDSTALAPVLGYLGKLSPKEAESNPDYFLTEKIGKAGLEFVYEKILRGQPGQRLWEIDALGRLQKNSVDIPSSDGQGLVLSLDSELQKKLYDSLAKVVRKKHGAAAVALDPQTGEVLALVSVPSFDSNAFSQGLSAAQFQELSADPSLPLFNRAVSGQYAPGSTVKPLVAAAALQEKIITPQTTIFDSGEITIVNQYNPNVIYHFPDWKAHGLVNLFSAIAESCDVYFYTIGGGYGSIEGLGIEKMADYFRFFGFGEKTGVDLPDEGVGLVPDEQWKEETKNESWYIGDTYHVSIGQGDLLVTPLQLAVATGAVANGGKAMRPYLVDKIIDSDKNIIKETKTEIIRENFIAAENLALVRQGMRQAVTAGSARLLNDLPVEAGAKTGTAQLASQSNTNAWATAFAPYDNPQIAIAVLVENAGEGSTVAIPIIRQILQDYFNKE